MKKFLEVKSIDQLHQLLAIEKPVHPLISIVRHTKEMNLAFATDICINNHLYFISLKEKVKGAFKYGRESYDFQEGTLVYMRPGQTISSNHEIEPDLGGLSIFFHPDLIRSYPLSSIIIKYTFFDYYNNEALHISDKERKSIYDIVAKIETEIHQNIDDHTEELVVHNIELLLKYSQRYFDRQFITRKKHQKDFVATFEQFLLSYFESNAPIDKGIPTVTQCGESLQMSGKYLSDLLRKETGKSITEHIQLHIIEKAKNKLLNSEDSISQIAFKLGFKYPQHFSKIFKTNTGISPKEYRSLN